MPCMLNAAKPVVAAMVQVKSCDGQGEVTYALIASMRNDLPVPPTPHTNMESGLKAHLHVLFS